MIMIIIYIFSSILRHRQAKTPALLGYMDSFPYLDLYNSPSRTDTDMACAEP